MMFSRSIVNFENFILQLSRKYWFLAIIFGGIVIIVVTALGIHNSSDDYTKELQLVHIVSILITETENMLKQPYFF